MIEIDLTSPSLDKCSILARVGVPEIWRYDDERIRIYRLAGAQYVEHAQSVALQSMSSIMKIAA